MRIINKIKKICKYKQSNLYKMNSRQRLIRYRIFKIQGKAILVRIKINKKRNKKNKILN